MPRKAFLEDVKSASDLPSVDGISGVRLGEEDGHVLFDLQQALNGPIYTLTAIVSDVFDYPTGHCYFLSASDDAPIEIAVVLERLSGTDLGSNLESLLWTVSRKLKTQDANGDACMSDLQPDEYDDYDDAASFDDFDDDVFEPTVAKAAATGTKSNSAHNSRSTGLRARIRSDLWEAKCAGFKVGIHGDVIHGLPCYVSISCRICKLGVSEEAMQAWKVDPNEYLTLIIQYPNGYRSMPELHSQDSVQQRRDIKFAVRVNRYYKPTLSEAISAFSALSSAAKLVEEANYNLNGAKDGLRNCFISGPLDQLLNDRLLKLMAYRAMGMLWNGSEQFYNDHQGMQCAMSQALADEYLAPEIVNRAYPTIVNADHFATSSMDQSFPLVAMQFLLRHFVRCSEFCLVCFCKMSDDLGALKPYVCDKPLCLYQYMSLGFGPSIEHEILTQPHVVDLLISFCHSAASYGDKFHTFPVGLGLNVPPHVAFPRSESRRDVFGQRAPTPKTMNNGKASSSDESSAKPQELHAKFNEGSLELLFEGYETCPVRVGDWIVITKVGKSEKHRHCGISSTTYFPSVQTSKPVYSGPGTKPQSEEAEKTRVDLSPTFESASFYTYDQNFDHLNDAEKSEVIQNLLDLLPSVQELREHITSTGKELSAWTDRISPALAGLLRWIIASSRACIIQVDDLDTTDAERQKNAENRLHGMPGWMQFRFAMGAPDKERRFIDAVNAKSAKLEHPTLFAWHGSPLANWHSIIREGLHYKYVTSGRSYGNGCYHALQSSVSTGYSGYSRYSHSYSAGGWQRSRLNVTCALALSEIVNAPEEFQCRSPYLVVQHLEWIQTRYLFVQCGNSDIKLEDPKMPPTNVHLQDPKYHPCGLSGKLVIPSSAFGRQFGRENTNPREKLSRKFKNGIDATFKSGGSNEFDDAASVKTLPEDLDIFEKETVSTAASTDLSDLATSKSPSQLDVASLPLLQPPSYATTFATKRLLSDFRALVKIQDTQPPQQLGWYLNTNPDLMHNLHQWIVELHSFDPALPLAKDMKKRKIASVVLEIRFGKDFPISPPFVRVIRPRFLGFQQGGGGHVTLGGAICMELLTNNGWTAACTIDSVLLQIRLAMESTEPHPARLAPGGAGDYSIHEAVEAFERACRTHGWAIPSDLRVTTRDYGSDFQISEGV